MKVVQFSYKHCCRESGESCLLLT